MSDECQTFRLVIKGYLLRKGVKLVMIFLRDQFLRYDQYDGGNQ